MPDLQTGYLPGSAQPVPLLSTRAEQTEVIPENFIAPIVFPDARVEDFAFIAPLRGNEGLEAEDDDTIGRKGDLKEVMMSEGYYSAETGAHGRKIIIGQLDIMRARDAQRLAGAGGNGEVFNLELRATNLITSQTRRHNELLAVRQLIDPTNYDASHVLAELDVVNGLAADIRVTLAQAAKLVEVDSGRGPANVIILGGGAAEGFDYNASFLALLPDDAVKVMDPETLRQLIRLPRGSRVVEATARTRAGASGSGTYMMDNFIWVGRVDPAPRTEGSNESAPFIPNERANSAGSFGWNFWRPTPQNGQRYYVNRIQVGNIENIHIGVQTFYRPLIENPEWGVLIPTTPVADALAIS